MDMGTGQVEFRSGRWRHSWEGRRISSWTEAEAIAQALMSFFPNGPTDSIDVLSDSTSAVGAFCKGYSLKYAVHRAIQQVNGKLLELDAKYWHIDGCSNVDADALSRYGFINSESIHCVPERVRRLVLGVSSRVEDSHKCEE